MNKQYQVLDTQIILVSGSKLWSVLHSNDKKGQNAIIEIQKAFTNWKWVSGSTPDRCSYWKWKTMSEDCFHQSHHPSVCLSTHKPSAAILSLNYCTQHIPVNHTHECMHTRTCILNSKHLNMKHCQTHNRSYITLSLDLMGHIFLDESTNNILLTSTEDLVSHEHFVR